MNKKRSWLKAASIRKPIHLLVGVAIFLLLQSGHLSLATVVAGGAALGLLLGKVFCRWMCPMGFLMELMTGMLGTEKARSMYQYHKLGCPIAWVSGLLNRISLVTVKHRIVKSCTHCGLCDSACYVSSFDQSYSLHKEGGKNPSNSYTCSRCLACVDSCPTGHLAVGVRAPGAKA